MRKTTLIALAQAVAFAFSTKRVRECFTSLLGTKDDWQLKNGEGHRTKPYPMGFYPNDKNLYWAIGWGMHEPMFPWERWLVRRAAAVRELRA
jgi:hypothetical protein